MLIFYATDALAIFELANPETNKVREYLGMIFGKNIGGISLITDSRSVLTEIFEKFNAIITAIGGIVISYVAIVSTVNTSHEGQVMGKKWSAVWIPLRSLSGILLMVPTPGSGYSIVQTCVMWAILQGDNAANLIWNIVLKHSSYGVGVNATSALPSDYFDEMNNKLDELFPKIIKSQICIKSLAKVRDSTAGIAVSIPTQMVNSFTNNLVGEFLQVNEHEKNCVMYQYKDPTSVYNDICGSIKFDFAIEGSGIVGATAQQVAEIENRTYLAKKQGLQDANKSLNIISDYIISNPKSAVRNSDYSHIKKLFLAAKTSYIKAMQSLIKPQKEPSNLLGSHEGKQNGWMVAGVYHLLLTRSVKEVFPTAKKIPESVAENLDRLGDHIGTDNESYKYVKSRILAVDNFMRKQEEASEFATDFKHATGVLENSFEIPYFGESLSSIVTPRFTKQLFNLQKQLFHFLQREMVNGVNDPVVSSAKFGNKLMLLAETVWIGIPSMILTQEGRLNILPENISPIFIAVLIGPIYALLSVCWVFGATCSIYVPLLPYLIFLITVIGWFVLVIEAMVAAPILALTLVLPSNDELGKLTQGINILLGICLRPTLMIIGFVIAGQLHRTALSFINYTFAEAIRLLPTISMFSCITVTCIYTGLIMVLPNKTFALIHMLPDKLMRWLGSQGEQTDVALLQETKQQYFEPSTKNVETAMSSFGHAGLERFGGGKDKNIPDGSGLSTQQTLPRLPQMQPELTD